MYIQSNPWDFSRSETAELVSYISGASKNASRSKFKVTIVFCEKYIPYFCMQICNYVLIVNKLNVVYAKLICQLNFFSPKPFTAILK